MEQDAMEWDAMERDAMEWDTMEWDTGHSLAGGDLQCSCSPTTSPLQGCP